MESTAIIADNRQPVVRLSQRFFEPSMADHVAAKLDALEEMLGQRDVFVALGVKFQPVRNYAGLWSITVWKIGGAARI